MIMMQPLRRSLLWSVVALFILFLTPVRAGADLPTTPESFVDFLDDLVVEAMHNYHVPNVVVAVVRGDSLYALRGYGEGDISTGAAIDPDTTLLRVASLSKPVVATAVMTLVEQGLIDLDDDVNQYLDAFQVATVGGTAVTFAHLLTHSGGLDDKIYYPTYVTDPAGYLSLTDALASSPPVRYAPSGQQIRYSNQGYLLLGYLIEQISGMSFAAYVQEFVFKPLEMHSSTFEQELSPAQQARLAKRYDFTESSGFVEDAFIYVNEMPAGGLYTTGSDMANFMQMHLNQGQWHGRTILTPESVAQMHASQFSNHPALGGYGYGFWQATHNGRLLVMHDGGGPAVSARLILLPAENVGIFVAHQGGDPRFYLTVTQQILDAYFGPATAVAAQTGIPAAQFAGLYKGNRYVRDGYFRLPTRIGMELNIQAEGEELLLDVGLFPGEQVYIQTAPGVFQQTNNPDNLLVFQLDENNQVTGLTAILYKIPLDFEPAPWYESNNILLIVLLGPSIIFLLTIIILPLTALYHRLKKRTYERRQVAVRWLAWLFSLSGLSMMFLFMLGETSPLARLSPHLAPVSVYALLTFAHVVALLALVFLAVWGVGLRRRYWHFWGAAGYTILAIAALLYLWFSYYNNLIGYLNY